MLRFNTLMRTEDFKQATAAFEDANEQTWHDECEQEKKSDLVQARDEQAITGFILKIGPSCAHARHLNGTFVAINDARQNPGLLPPYSECRENTCMCERDFAWAGDAPPVDMNKKGRIGCVIMIAVFFLLAMVAVSVTGILTYLFESGSRAGA